MKVLLYPEFEKIIVAEQEIPKFQPNEVLLKVASVGICGSELESFKNRSPRRPPPLVMGHEFCGVIEEAGSEVDHFEKGQKVISNSVVHCGECPMCLRGDEHLCTDREIFGMHRGGAFAEYVSVPSRCLIPWPENVDANMACLAEPLGNGIHMANLTKHLEIETMLIIGAGPIGLMAIQAFKTIRQPTIIVSDLSPDRLEAATTVGADIVVDSTNEDLKSIIDHNTELGADLVIDAVGSTQTGKQGLAVLRPGGTMVLIGLHENNNAIESYDLILQEKTIMGTYATTIEELRAALTLMEARKISTDSWVKTFPIIEGVDAFFSMLEGKGSNIKAVLNP